MTTALTPVPLANYACNTGEGPLWDDRRQCLFWSDIPSGKLFRIDIPADTHRQIYSGPPVGGYTLQEDGKLLLFRVNDIALFDPDTGESKKVMDFHDEGCPRFNDVSADPMGRVYAGTMGKTNESGGLFRLDPDGRFTLLFRGTGCANGSGWSPDRKTFYWTDSSHNHIDAFDYDAPTGDLHNRRRLYTADRAKEGTCDGMTVAADGNLWSTRWDGHAIRILSPQGAVLSEIRFPVAKVSSCIFGGPSLTDLYVTTAGGDTKDTSRPEGTLYRIAGAGKGMTEFRSRLAV